MAQCSRLNTTSHRKRERESNNMNFLNYRLEPILTPYLSELQGLNSVECSQQSKAKTIFHLKLIASLFQSLDVKQKADNKNITTSVGSHHPVALIFPQILPLLQQVFPS